MLEIILPSLDDIESILDFKRLSSIFRYLSCRATFKSLTVATPILKTCADNALHKFLIGCKSGLLAGHCTMSIFLNLKESMVTFAL